MEDSFIGLWVGLVDYSWQAAQYVLFGPELHTRSRTLAASETRDTAPSAPQFPKIGDTGALGRARSRKRVKMRKDERYKKVGSGTALVSDMPVTGPEEE